MKSIYKKVACCHWNSYESFVCKIRNKVACTRSFQLKWLSTDYGNVKGSILPYISNPKCIRISTKWKVFTTEKLDFISKFCLYFYMSHFSIISLFWHYAIINFLHYHYISRNFLSTIHKNFEYSVDCIVLLSWFKSSPSFNLRSTTNRHRKSREMTEILDLSIVVRWLRKIEIVSNADVWGTHELIKKISLTEFRTCDKEQRNRSMFKVDGYR